MQDLILNIIAESLDNYFVFDRNHENPILQLKQRTENVPDVSGLYFVFYRQRMNNDIEHLKLRGLNALWLTLAKLVESLKLVKL